MVAGIVDEIPFPGMPESQSQIAVPMLAGGRLVGVLFAESPATGKFGYEEEDALVRARERRRRTPPTLYEPMPEPADDQPRAAQPQPAAPAGAPVRIRHYAENDSIFVDEDYLIKGVAGAILWRLARGYVEEQPHRVLEPRAAPRPSIRLPDLSENLEARLILLQRRLEERCPALGIEKTGRGRFRFYVRRPIQLVDIPR